MGNGLCGAQGLVGGNAPAQPSAAGNGRNEQSSSPSIASGSPIPAVQIPVQTQTAASPGEPTRTEGSPQDTAPTTAVPSASRSAPTSRARVALMAPTPEDRKAAENLKAEGNALFSKGKYAAAMERYTEAITLCPEWAVLYVNRGMAARKRGDWDRVVTDADAALGLCPGGGREAMKGHYLMGLAMGAKMKHDKSTHHLQKALDAAREANDSIKDEIWRELATANFQRWQLQSDARRAQAKQLQRQLAELLGLSSSCHGGGEGKTNTRDLGGGGGGAEEPKLPPEWAALFAAASWQDTAAEAPSQFTCPLTMEIFRDPVVVPSGRSYERSALLEHLKKVGRFDPITRQHLSEEQLVPNVSLRAAIELYLEEHPWGWGEVK
ncbi:hypothetical protein Vretimale_6359 [Volvox reticuliferus]|uniref:E3 ubiquitin-protein ligase CHIP n=1 Tax=Volvox reticuliferus TaxID=1737510 RepID=A0A8J4CT02_9CHLO|nr:hypothetical protein Vretifemale_16024 [Volvox reticuliferus]GIM01567.1 hypothetical protein Vretimale_6359 [Volvox reticuliferus]